MSRTQGAGSDEPRIEENGEGIAVSGSTRTLRSEIVSVFHRKADRLEKKSRGDDTISKAEICRFYAKRVESAADPAELARITLADVHAHLWDHGYRQSLSRDDFSNVEKALRRALYEVGNTLPKSLILRDRNESHVAGAGMEPRTNGSLTLEPLLAVVNKKPYKYTIQDLDEPLDEILTRFREYIIADQEQQEQGGDEDESRPGKRDAGGRVEIPGRYEGDAVVLEGAERLKQGAEVVVVARREDVETDELAPRVDSLWRLLSFSGAAQLGGDAVEDTEEMDP
jgi:hypothetical protein